MRRSIPCAHLSADFRWLQIHFSSRLSNTFERLLQVEMDIVVQRLERGDIERVNAGMISSESFCIRIKAGAEQIIDAPKKGGQGLPRAGWG